MVRFIHCVKAKAGVSDTDFRDAFTGERMKELASRFVEATDAISYKLRLTLKIDLNIGLMEERGGVEPFDGIMEIWWESGSGLLEFKESDEFKKLQDEMTSLQETFVDFSLSSRFFIED